MNVQQEFTSLCQKNWQNSINMKEFEIYNDLLLDRYLSQSDEEEIDEYEIADQIRDERRNEE